MKKWKLVVLVSALMCLLLGMQVMAADDDFVIDQNGVLTKYQGEGGDVEIPDGVTGIEGAFFGCASLTSVTIPNSVTSIDGAFWGWDI